MHVLSQLLLNNIRYRQPNTDIISSEDLFFNTPAPRPSIVSKTSNSSMQLTLLYLGYTNEWFSKGKLNFEVGFYEVKRQNIRQQGQKFSFSKLQSFCHLIAAIQESMMNKLVIYETRGFSTIAQRFSVHEFFISGCNQVNIIMVLQNSSLFFDFFLCRLT